MYFKVGLRKKKKWKKQTKHWSGRQMEVEKDKVMELLQLPNYGLRSEQV